MKEIWKDIEGYEGLYQVSNLGRVKSLKRNASCFFGNRRIEENILKQQTKWNYKAVNLCKEGKKKSFTIHRLVATHFISNPENKPEVNHIDGNKFNNESNNLEWVTSSENGIHAYDTELSKTGKGNRKCDKLTEADVKIIKKMFKDGARICEVHRTFSSVCRSTISEIKAGRNWKNIEL